MACSVTSIFYLGPANWQSEDGRCAHLCVGNTYVLVLLLLEQAHQGSTTEFPLSLKQQKKSRDQTQLQEMGKVPTYPFARKHYEVTAPRCG